MVIVVLGDSDMMLVINSVIVADGDSKKLSVFVFVTGVRRQRSFQCSIRICIGRLPVTEGDSVITLVIKSVSVVEGLSVM